MGAGVVETGNPQQSGADAQEEAQRWGQWAAANYPPDVASAVRAAALDALQRGGDQRAAYEAALAAAGQRPADTEATCRPRDSQVSSFAESLTAEVAHDRGSTGISDKQELVVRMRSRNPLTRRESLKEVRVPSAEIGGVLVVSRDRTVFGVDVWDRTGALVQSVRGIEDKQALDELMRRVEVAGSHFKVMLAHPSHGLVDPHPKQVERERKGALSFNSDEQRARANSGRQEAKVKTYENSAAYSRDARRMTSDGWMPHGQSSGRGRVSMSGTATKLVLTGGLGAVTGFSRKGSKVTVTWVRTLPFHTPRAFLPVPDVPLPRTFPAEPYFPVRALVPVAKGHEFPEPAAQPTSTERKVPPAQSRRQVVAPPTPAVVSLQGTRAQPSDPRVPSTSVASSSNVVDRMRGLEELKRAGLISEEEYLAKRTELISGL